MSEKEPHKGADGLCIHHSGLSCRPDPPRSQDALGSQHTILQGLASIHSMIVMHEHNALQESEDLYHLCC